MASAITGLFIFMLRNLLSAENLVLTSLGLSNATTILFFFFCLLFKFWLNISLWLLTNARKSASPYTRLLTEVIIINIMVAVVTSIQQERQEELYHEQYEQQIYYFLHHLICIDAQWHCWSIDDGHGCQWLIPTAAPYASRTTQSNDKLTLHYTFERQIKNWQIKFAAWSVLVCTQGRRGASSIMRFGGWWYHIGLIPPQY